MLKEVVGTARKKRGARCNEYFIFLDEVEDGGYC